jgi:hypothetical protein
VQTPKESVHNVGITLGIPGRPRLQQGRYLGERYPLPVYGRKLESVHMQSPKWLIKKLNVYRMFINL